VSDTCSVDPFNPDDGCDVPVPSTVRKVSFAEGAHVEALCELDFAFHDAVVRLCAGELYMVYFDEFKWEQPLTPLDNMRRPSSSRTTPSPIPSVPSRIQRSKSNGRLSPRLQVKEPIKHEARTELFQTVDDMTDSQDDQDYFWASMVKRVNECNFLVLLAQWKSFKKSKSSWS
jgi:hypothetical protein